MLESRQEIVEKERTKCEIYFDVYACAAAAEHLPDAQWGARRRALFPLLRTIICHGVKIAV